MISVREVYIPTCGKLKATLSHSLPSFTSLHFFKSVASTPKTTLAPVALIASTCNIISGYFPIATSNVSKDVASKRWGVTVGGWIKSSAWANEKLPKIYWINYKLALNFADSKIKS